MAIFPAAAPRPRAMRAAPETSLYTTCAIWRRRCRWTTCSKSAPLFPVPAQMTMSTTDKSLARFLEQIHCKQKGHRSRFPERYHLIQRIDDCFVGAGTHLTDAKPIFTGPMFLRSQYAYKVAAGMTLAGQFSEVICDDALVSRIRRICAPDL